MYIDNLEFQYVLKMAEFWALEPPMGWTVAAQAGYGRIEEATPPPPPGMLGRASFRQMPKWLQNSMIKKSGLTEVEFYRKLKQKEQEKLIKKAG